MPLPSGPLPTFGTTIGLQSGPSLTKIIQLLASTQVIPVATPAGNKTTSIKLTASKVVVVLVTSANDSVVLPSGYPGLEITIKNNAASNSLRIFAAGSDVIDAALTQLDLANLKITTLTCMSRSSAGVAQWYSQLGG